MDPTPASNAFLSFFRLTGQVKPVEWTESWVSNVHCGRRWRFQRFVPPSLMSALISRFYGMGKRGSAILTRRSIYIKIPIGGSGGKGTGRWVRS